MIERTSQLGHIARMSWVAERDKLIAETLAFVKQVSGEQPAPAATLQAAVETDLEAAGHAMPIVPRMQTTAMSLADLRQDIRDRVDAFKARQHALQNEREQHYRDSLGRLRAELSPDNNN